jgi:hypothetical protein
VSFLDINDVERDAILKLLVNAIQLGNPGSEGWSGVAAKNQGNRFDPIFLG